MGASLLALAKSIYYIACMYALSVHAVYTEVL